MNDRFEKYKSKKAPAKVALKRMSKSAEWFARTTVSQVEILLDLKTVCWPLLAILQLESLRCKGKSFALPTDTLIVIKGLRPSNLHRALQQLETSDLISVQRRPSKPPLITLL